jgi:hypothetical protein
VAGEAVCSQNIGCGFDSFLAGFRLRGDSDQKANEKADQ